MDDLYDLMAIAASDGARARRAARQLAAPVAERRATSRND